MKEGEWEIRKTGKDTCSVEKYLGSDAAVSVPERIGSYVPVEIGAKFLRKSNKVVSLTLPKSVEYIDPEAFSTWRSMESVSSSGRKLKSQDGVLYDGQLKSLVFYPPKRACDDFEAPDTVKRVLPGAFSASVPFRTFSFCSLDEYSARPSDAPRLECFVSLGNGSLSVREGVLFKGKSLVSYPASKKERSYAIPEGTESIEEYGEPMFPSAVESLEVPSSLKSGL